MPKADFKLPNGTVVNIEGSVEEVTQLLATLGGASSTTHNVGPRADPGKKKKAGSKRTARQRDQGADDSGRLDTSEIVNLIKDSDDAESIERAILDRAGQVNRILLPLFILHEQNRGDQSLSSQEIAHVTKELGVPISQPNVSRALSGTVSKYVMADSVRAKGKRTGYRLSRRGITYMKSVIAGEAGEE